MGCEQLTEQSRQRLETVFTEDQQFANRLWDEMAGTNPELHTLISHEAQRLFPDNSQLRARATRLVVEAIQAIRIAEIEPIV